ncbi:unnamed protein product [Echinostoma caproni]|uniref:Uncharacterized protein n=1 Tax=Echinostoma caproni TaxID=27848 RepID=A0A183A8A8_9TREM|nr:unnamed protein product [Echinostoma caproni]
MLPFRQRAAWLHIDLPGQGDGEEELPANYQFPPIHKLPEAMKSILDHFNENRKLQRRCLYSQVTVLLIAQFFSVYAQLNIVVLLTFNNYELIALIYLQIMYDSLVLGAILIHCTGQSASFAQAIKDKLVNWKLNMSGMNPATESFLILHRFGPIMDTDSEVELRNAVENFRQNLRHSINPKNLNKFITSYMQCPALLIAGSLSSQHRACRQFYEDLTKAQKNSEQSSSTREFVMVDGVANVIAERVSSIIPVLY